MFDFKFALLGGGNMAEAILRGVLDQDVFHAEALCVSDAVPARRDFLRSAFPGVSVLEDNAELVRRSEAVLFAVKPQNMKDVLAQVAAAATPRHLFLSICAGTRTETIQDGLRRDAHPSPRVVRVMPNTPALIGLGVAGGCAGAHASADDVATAQRIFEAVGEFHRVDEALMDAVTALTGSGPAYVFYLIESLIEGGRRVGFPEEQARAMVLQMVLGAATLARQSDKSPEELRRAVTSPGGTTAAGIAVLEEAGVKEFFARCVQAAEARGRELGKK